MVGLEEELFTYGNGDGLHCPSLPFLVSQLKSIERQADYEDVIWILGRAKERSTPDEVLGDVRRSLMYDHVYVSDRLWNGALLRGCAAPGPFMSDWLVWSCVMVPSALCCFSFFTYKHRSQWLRGDEPCFVIFTYTSAQKCGQIGKS